MQVPTMGAAGDLRQQGTPGQMAVESRKRAERAASDPMTTAETLLELLRPRFRHYYPLPLLQKIAFHQNSTADVHGAAALAIRYSATVTPGDMDAWLANSPYPYPGLDQWLLKDWVRNPTALPLRPPDEASPRLIAWTLRDMLTHNLWASATKPSQLMNRHCREILTFIHEHGAKAVPMLPLSDWLGIGVNESVPHQRFAIAMTLLHHPAAVDAKVWVDNAVSRLIQCPELEQVHALLLDNHTVIESCLSNDTLEAMVLRADSESVRRLCQTMLAITIVLAPYGAPVVQVAVRRALLMNTPLHLEPRVLTVGAGKLHSAFGAEAFVAAVEDLDCEARLRFVTSSDQCARKLLGDDEILWQMAASGEEMLAGIETHASCLVEALERVLGWHAIDEKMTFPLNEALFDSLMSNPSGDIRARMILASGIVEILDSVEITRLKQAAYRHRSSQGGGLFQEEHG